jgi:hypothetical protein
MRTGKNDRTSMEEMGELRKSEQRTRLMYRIVCWVSGITILAVFVYGVVSAAVMSKDGAVDVGASLVGVEFPFSFFAKPVSYLSIACVTFFYSGVRLWQNRIAMWSQFRLSILQLSALVIAFASAYEIMYNFMLWGAIYSIEVLRENIISPDIVTSPSPVPWNLVFATKMFLALFVISGYAVYFLRRVHRFNGFGEEI